MILYNYFHRFGIVIVNMFNVSFSYCVTLMESFLSELIVYWRGFHGLLSQDCLHLEKKSPWTATCHGVPRARRCDYCTEMMSAKSGVTGRGRGRGKGRGGEGTRRRTGEEDEASSEYLPPRQHRDILGERSNQNLSPSRVDPWIFESTRCEGCRWTGKAKSRCGRCFPARWGWCGGSTLPWQ